MELNEGFIHFFTTYKFITDKNVYKKGKIPTWTDRILFRDNLNGLKLL